jgi:hypothetical protein
MNKHERRIGTEIGAGQGSAFKSLYLPQGMPVRPRPFFRAPVSLTPIAFALLLPLSVPPDRCAK